MDVSIHLLFTVQIPHPLQKLLWAGVYYQCIFTMEVHILYPPSEFCSPPRWFVSFAVRKTSSQFFSLVNFLKSNIIQLPSILKITEKNSCFEHYVWISVSTWAGHMVWETAAKNCAAITVCQFISREVYVPAHRLLVGVWYSVINIFYWF